MGLRSEVLERWSRFDDGARQRVNSYWRGIADADPQLRTVVACLECVFGDVVVRVATHPLKATSSKDGVVFAFLPGLSGFPTVEQAVSINGGAAQVRTINITIPGRFVDAFTVISNGRALCGVAELSLMVDGMNYDNRFVLLRGDITGVTFGTTSEDVTLALADPKLTDATLVPEVVATSTRWPSIGSDAVGKRYPLVINGADMVQCLPIVYNVPADGKFLVCSGHGFGTVLVWVNGVSKLAGDATYPWAKAELFDANGAPVTAIDFTSGAATWEDRDVVHASVTTDTSIGGAPSESLVSVIWTLLRGYTAFGNAGTNPDLFADAQGKLPGWVPRIVINASGDRAVSVLKFIEDELLAAYPMLSLVYEGRGVGPVVIDRRNPTEGVLTGGEFPLRERTSKHIESTKTAMFNAFEVRYGYDAIADRYTGIVIVDDSNSSACRLSRSDAFAGARRAYTPIQSPWIPDAAAANAITSWLVAHLALPSYTVEWTCDPWTWMRYRRGQNVLYTDSRIGWSNAVATIESLPIDLRNPTIRLRVWHPYWQEDGAGLA